jgi:hypothetical protein
VFLSIINIIRNSCYRYDSLYSFVTSIVIVNLIVYIIIITMIMIIM